MISIRLACLLTALAAIPLGAAPALSAPKHLQPVPADALATMRAKDVDPQAPILIRAFKRESTMEVWKRARSGRYVLVKAFPICRWSGQLGPKRGKGDRQTPEGFYSVTAQQMNPSSQYHLAFDTGFPNAFDRANRSSGSALMVHGTCSSAGCYAMTDRGIEEIYAMAREALAGGQRAFQFQSYPFHMTAENIVKARLDPNVAFWVQLKTGSDRFEATGEEPRVEVDGNRYAFPAYPDRAREVAAIRRLNDEAVSIARLLSEGVPAMRWTYADGGQHPLFSAQASLVQPKGDVSRPEALALAGQETVVPGTSVRQQFRMPPQWPMPAEAPSPPPVAQDLRAALAMAGLAMPPPANAPLSEPMRWPAPLGDEPSTLSPVPLAAGAPMAMAMAGAQPVPAPWEPSPQDPVRPPAVAKAAPLPAPPPVRRF